MTNERIDFLVLAPLQEEIDALLEAFEISSTAKRVVPESALPYYDCNFKGFYGSFRIRIVKLRKQGVLNAAVVSTRLLLRWEPTYLVSFGITGGFLGDELALQDVIVAEHVYYYEPAKEISALSEDTGTKGPRESRRLSRIDPYFADPHFVRICGNAAEGDARFTNKVRFGAIASGEKLIKDLNSPSRRAIREHQEKMLGVEMEAAGVAAAARSQSPPARFVAIKGVSDDATENKDRTVSCRIPAAQSAALFLRTVLEGYFERDAEPVSRNFQVGQEALIKAKKFQEELNGHLVEPVDEMQLAGMIDNFEEPPSIYYHWRSRHDFVHWVDLHYLLLLRKVLHLGLPVQVVITDSLRLHSDAARRQIERTVRGVLPINTKIRWSSEMGEIRNEFKSYATSIDFDDSVRRTIKAAYAKWPSNFGEENVVRTAEELVQFIAWNSRRTKQCILLQWQRNNLLTEALRTLFGYEALSLLVGDLALGQRLGKFEERLDLLIAPPDYPHVVSWLQSGPRVEEVRDLCRYLSIALPEYDSGLDTTLFENWVELSSGTGNSEQAAAIRCLSSALAGLNSLFFSKEGERS